MPLAQSGLACCLPSIFYQSRTSKQQQEALSTTRQSSKTVKVSPRRRFCCPCFRRARRAEAPRCPQCQLGRAPSTSCSAAGASYDDVHEMSGARQCPEFEIPIIVLHGNSRGAEELDWEATLLQRHCCRRTAVSVEYCWKWKTNITGLERQLRNLSDFLCEFEPFLSCRLVDVVAHSNGGVLARAMAQNPEKIFRRSNVRVRHLVTLGSPHCGVGFIPNINETLGAALMTFLPALCRLQTVQNMVGSAAYVYDRHGGPVDRIVPQKRDEVVGFLEKLNLGKFLDMGGAGGEDDGRFGGGREDDGVDTIVPVISDAPKGSARQQHAVEDDLAFSRASSDPGSTGRVRPSHRVPKNSLLNIAGSLLLIRFDRDEVCLPRDSAWFSRYAHDTLYPLTETEVWTRDSIGLRELDKQGRLFLYACDTKHDKMEAAELEAVVGSFLRVEERNSAVGRLRARMWSSSSSATSTVGASATSRGGERKGAEDEDHKRLVADDSTRTRVQVRLTTTTLSTNSCSSARQGDVPIGEELRRASGSAASSSSSSAKSALSSSSLVPERAGSVADPGSLWDKHEGEVRASGGVRLGPHQDRLPARSSSASEVVGGGRGGSLVVEAESKSAGAGARPAAVRGGGSSVGEDLDCSISSTTRVDDPPQDGPPPQFEVGGGRVADVAAKQMVFLHLETREDTGLRQIVRTTSIR